MSAVILMCGLTFSGKTTLGRHIAATLGCDYISLDAINDERGLWGGHGVPVEEWERSHQTAHERACRSLSRGQHVVVDDTSNLRWLRDRWRDIVHRKGHALALVYVETPLDEITERMHRAESVGDRRAVSSDVLDEHVKTFQPPTTDEAPLAYRTEDDPNDLLAQLAIQLGASRSD